ncbi:hypothetical protein Q8W71_28565 [Methylobacterium sp. NEAU 140]|uniref:hypothetical protein n=1 Tax=Methylobacterium sp. NEAU 140 TaxID=3064945 RepID=UPI0027356671|nr:hypothetical protein [Methylobacterium sp. NEAU 140]MDP4026572.1 hypothetical protein [Methylobacterium sp. NEAU 140]
MIVVSTEIVAALYLPGDLTEIAEAVLLRDPHWCSPMIWRALLPHHLSEPIRSGAISREIADMIVRAAPSLFLSREFPSPLHDNMQFIHDSRCSAFIAPFLDLARGLGVRLITTDRMALEDFPDIAQSAAEFAAQ